MFRRVLLNLCLISTSISWWIAARLAHWLYMELFYGRHRWVSAAVASRRTCSTWCTFRNVWIWRKWLITGNRQAPCPYSTLGSILSLANFYGKTENGNKSNLHSPTKSMHCIARTIIHTLSSNIWKKTERSVGAGRWSTWTSTRRFASASASSSACSTR